MPNPEPFFGRWVVRGAFAMAVFGWGVGFYGPPIFLQNVLQRTGWSLPLVSAAVTLHFLCGAAVITQLPRLQRRFGIGVTVIAGSIITSLGLAGWALTQEPWQLFVSACLGGAGWVCLGAVTVNAVIAPWYDKQRPVALAKAYNGASMGGVFFSPLWVWLIATLGFGRAAVVVGMTMVLVACALAHFVFSRTPQMLNQRPDGESFQTGKAVQTQTPIAGSPKASTGHLWSERRFITLALGMSLGLFAQIGLLSHLFSLFMPTLGAQVVGFALGFGTICAIGGRFVIASLANLGIDRRILAAGGYAVQAAGVLVLLGADPHSVAQVLSGIALFGSGNGNSTSLPPLIAQKEFARADQPRVIALVVATAQASYAFAPAALGFVLALQGTPAVGTSAAATFFLAVAGIQALAAAAFLSGERR